MHPLIAADRGEMGTMLNRLEKDLRDARVACSVLTIASDPAVGAWSADELGAASLAAEGRRVLGARSRPVRDDLGSWRARAWATLRVMAASRPREFAACVDRLPSPDDRRRVARAARGPRGTAWVSASRRRTGAANLEHETVGAGS